MLARVRSMLMAHWGRAQRFLQGQEGDPRPRPDSRTNALGVRRTIVVVALGVVLSSSFRLPPGPVKSTFDDQDP